jgi:hypothetical protein
MPQLIMRITYTIFSGRLQKLSSQSLITSKIVGIYPAS